MSKAKAPPDPGHQALIQFWCEAWSEFHEGLRYPFNNGKDAKAIKELRGMVPGDVELRRLMLRYLQLDEPWITEHGHSLAILKSSLPQVIQAGRALQGIPVNKRLRGLAEWSSGSSRK